MNKHLLLVLGIIEGVTAVGGFAIGIYQAIKGKKMVKEDLDYISAQVVSEIKENNKDE